MVVYDVTDRESFDAVQMWIGEVNRLAMPNVSKVLVGNKNDLNTDRKISYEEGEALAKKYGIKFLETSAKSSFNVLDSFLTMTKEMLDKATKKAVTMTGEDKVLKPAKEPKKLTLSKSTSKSGAACC